ncbi:PilZ domain-containing protein [Lysobacter fragariae]
MSRKKHKSRAAPKPVAARDTPTPMEIDAVPVLNQEKDVPIMPAVSTISESADDRRDAERVPFAARVMVVHGESAWFAQLLDMSEGGCGIFRPDGCDLIEDQVVRLFFYQDNESLAVIVPGRIARVTKTQVGIEYHDPQAIPPEHPAK